MQEVSKILSALKIKSKKIGESLKKEIEIIDKKETSSKNINEKISLTNNNQEKKYIHKILPTNWEIINNMISGIIKSMNIISNDKFRILNKFDFKMHNKIEIQSLTKNMFVKCKFKDYAPYVFEALRRQFGIVQD